MPPTANCQGVAALTAYCVAATLVIVALFLRSALLIVHPVVEWLAAPSSPAGGPSRGNAFPDRLRVFFLQPDPAPPCAWAEVAPLLGSGDVLLLRTASLAGCTVRLFGHC